MIEVPADQQQGTGMACLDLADSTVEFSGLENRSLPSLLPSRPPSSDSGDCRSFLVPSLHTLSGCVSDRACKVAFTISHLTGRAAAWATAEWARETVLCHDVKFFSKMLTDIIDHKSPGQEASRALLRLQQGRSRVVDYAIDFRRLAADSGWNGPALNDAFLHGLSDPIKDQLAPLELPPDLESIILTAVCIDSRLCENERDRRREMLPGMEGWKRRPGSMEGQHALSPQGRPHTPTLPSSGPDEPMQIGRAKLSPEEKLRHYTLGHSDPVLTRALLTKLVHTQ